MCNLLEVFFVLVFLFDVYDLVVWYLKKKKKFEIFFFLKALIAQNDEEENGGPNVDILINTGEYFLDISFNFSPSN